MQGELVALRCRAPHRLPVNGHHPASLFCGNAVDPVDKALAKFFGLQCAEQVADCIMRGHPFIRVELAEPVFFQTPVFRNRSPCVAAANDGRNSQKQYLLQRIDDVPFYSPARVLQSGEAFFKEVLIALRGTYGHFFIMADHLPRPLKSTLSKLYSKIFKSDFPAAWMKYLQKNLHIEV